MPFQVLKPLSTCAINALGIQQSLLFNTLLVPLPSLSMSSTFTVCDACQRGKSHQLSYISSQQITSFPLELSHTDV